MKEKSMRINVDYEFMTWKCPSVHLMSWAKQECTCERAAIFPCVWCSTEIKVINTATSPLFPPHWSMTIIQGLRRTLSKCFQSCEFSSLQTYLINIMLRRRKTADIKVWESFAWERKWKGREAFQGIPFPVAIALSQVLIKWLAVI